MQPYLFNGVLIKVNHFLVVSCLALISACGGGSTTDAPPPPSSSTPPPPVSLGELPGPRPIFGPREYVLFESAQTRPLVKNIDGTRLYAVNTPDNRVEVFAIEAAGLSHLYSIPVGVEPIALALAPDNNLWVVNHLSDNVSIVDLQQTPPRVINTLLVGDEPRDIVFAGNNNHRAFISTAHRGQNSPVDPQLTTPGVGRADIWVFNSDNLGSSLGGTPETIITVFGDRAGGLAVNADGSKVYAGIFLSGNRTTTIAPPGINKASPSTDSDGIAQPDTGLIVKFNGTNWVDERGVSFNGAVPFALPDFDVFEINASATTPVESNRWSGVGTTLFNLAVHPTNKKIYVSNIDARNHVRFAGQGNNNTTVNGHLADNRITVIDGSQVSPRFLNKHLTFNSPQGSLNDRNTSLSLPQQIVFNENGSLLYLAAYSSNKVVVFESEKIDNDSFVPNADNHIELSSGGVSGLVLDEDRDRAFVLTRFDNGISTIDLNNKLEIAHTQMFNPEPAHIIEGRQFQFDARLTSGKGNDSCATCHLFGDNDGLAWDLGDPEGSIASNPNTFISISPAAAPNRFHSMKGPMTTQSMRGIKGHGPMHWRGDRTGANRVNNETLEEAAFKEFNEAFVALLGRDEELTESQMQSFTDYAMELTYPPNPIRALDGFFNDDEAEGERIFNRGVVRVQTGALEICAQCHTLDIANGVFGTGGLMSDNSQPGERNMKIPHFRDQYQKVGMFGWGFQQPPATGSQVRGFGYNHNGATSGNFAIADLGMPTDELRQIRAFLFAFPSEQAPIVGQQITLTQENADQVNSRIELLVSQAQVTFPAPTCDLIVKGVIEGRSRGYLMNDQVMFISDSADENSLSLADLKSLANIEGQSLTFTCAPWGSGTRMGIDRDLDGILDSDDNTDTQTYKVE